MRPGERPVENVDHETGVCAGIVGRSCENPPFFASAARFGSLPSSIIFFTSAWSAPSNPRTTTRGADADARGAARKNVTGRRAASAPRRTLDCGVLNGMGHSSRAAGRANARARFSSALVACVLAASGAAGCRRALSHSKETLVVAIESSPLHFDPRVGTDQASWRTHDVLYDALLKKGAGGEFLPDLAESWATDDAVTWRFRLRSGVRFHDGRPCEAEDVAFTYRSLLADGFPSGKKEPLRIIESIETPSPLDVVFRLKQPYASFPLQLLLGILPRGTTPREADAAPVGTGPWRFVESRADDRVVFARFPGAVGGDAKLARLVLRVVPDATTRALELLNGSLDLSLNNLPPDLLPRLAESPRLAVTIRPGSTYAYLAFNFRDPVLGEREGATRTRPRAGPRAPSPTGCSATRSSSRRLFCLRGTGRASTGSRRSGATSPPRAACSTRRASPTRAEAGRGSRSRTRRPPTRPRSSRRRRSRRSGRRRASRRRSGRTISRRSTRTS